MVLGQAAVLVTLTRPSVGVLGEEMKTERLLTVCRPSS